MALLLRHVETWDNTEAQEGRKLWLSILDP